MNGVQHISLEEVLQSRFCCINEVSKKGENRNIDIVNVNITILIGIKLIVSLCRPISHSHTLWSRILPSYAGRLELAQLQTWTCADYWTRQADICDHSQSYNFSRKTTVTFLNYPLASLGSTNKTKFSTFLLKFVDQCRLLQECSSSAYVEERMAFS